VPHELRLAAHSLESPRRIPIVVRPGKDDDRDEGSIAHESSIWISKLSISGFARRSVHMRSIAS